MAFAGVEHGREESLKQSVVSEEIDGECSLQGRGWEGEDRGRSADACVIDEDCWRAMGFGKGCADG